MTFEEWITKTYKCHKFDPWTVDDCYKAWDAATEQAQDRIDRLEASMRPSEWRDFNKSLRIYLDES